MDEIKVSAGKLKDTLKAILREGNVRRIVIRNAQGRTLLDMPLTAGVAGVLLAPFWMAVTGVVALAKEFTVAIERDPGSSVSKAE
jgi:integral membrane sensor domain MASE1